MLQPLAFRPLAPGRIRPLGWLGRQLRLQADGLTGHLDEFWPDIRDSGWIGGTAEGWERAPYWLDGLAPLAFALGDERLLTKMDRWVTAILDRQHEDGWLGPVQSGGYQAYDSWPIALIGKVLMQYQEATGDARVIPALLRAMQRIRERIAEHPLFDWNRTRWQDLVLTVHWLHERTGEDWLLDLAAMLHDQGYDWRGHFADFRYRDKQPQWLQENHVVNHGMAIKASAVWWRQSGEDSDRRAGRLALQVLDQYHGQPNGLFSGDESLAGRHPSQGTELCAVVEEMFSLEMLLAITGEPWAGDLLEKLAYNALPATISPDMWSHQYDQQANQVICCAAQEPIYTNNGPQANLFGLEPNYGCCTADMHQGWPKFTTHLWMAAPDGGLAAMAWAPCEVETEAGGAPVRLVVTTDYPFDERITVTVAATGGQEFALHLRVPAWAAGAGATLNGQNLPAPEPGTFLIISRAWHAGDVLRLRLPMGLQVRRWYRDSVSVERGPLVYALRIGEEWWQVGGELPHADWEIHPTTPWNYALKLDPTDPDADLTCCRSEVGERPFSPEGAPLQLRARGRRLPKWGLVQNAADAPPVSPVPSDEPLEDLVLIPYGCTNLRLTAFPLLGD